MRVLPQKEAWVANVICLCTGLLTRVCGRTLDERVIEAFYGDIFVGLKLGISWAHGSGAHKETEVDDEAHEPHVEPIKEFEFKFVIGSTRDPFY